ncbi:SS18-like protein 2 [Nothoprocta perdicaria]|uniref:SS18-like protein 2 n=1 Tax=Nothoprocta perdicaria TaxID=30464 RepID=UPI000E1BCE2E|nr:SS18-like protein 2 [Nothoprocta perdicaria]
MSVAFVPERLRGKAEVNQETLAGHTAGGRRLLEENDQLIRCIVEYQSKGRATDCVQYQHILHRNLIYLATIADAAPPSSQKTVD